MPTSEKHQINPNRYTTAFRRHCRTRGAGQNSSPEVVVREEVGDSVDMFRIDGEEESESKGFDLTPALSSKRGGIVGSPFESLANRFVGRPPGEQVWAATQRRPCQSGNAPR